MIKRQTHAVCAVEGNTLSAAVVGEVDHHCAKELREEIDDAIFAVMPKKIILDLANVNFMDSSGLGIIMGRKALADKLGAEFSLRNPSKRVAHIIELSGLNRIIKIESQSEGGTGNA